MDNKVKATVPKACLSKHKGFLPSTVYFSTPTFLSTILCSEEGGHGAPHLPGFPNLTLWRIAPCHRCTSIPFWSVTWPTMGQEGLDEIEARGCQLRMQTVASLSLLLQAQNVSAETERKHILSNINIECQAWHALYVHLFHVNILNQHSIKASGTLSPATKEVKESKNPLVVWARSILNSQAGNCGALTKKAPQTSPAPDLEPDILTEANTMAHKRRAAP